MGKKELSGNNFTEDTMVDDKYPDSNTPELKEELEEYGVWVKAGPEDIEVEEPDSEDFELQDLDTDNTEEDYLTDEEEELLGSLEEDGSPDDDEEDIPLGTELKEEEMTFAQEEAVSEEVELPEIEDLDDIDIDIDVEETLMASSEVLEAEYQELDTDNLMEDFDSSDLESEPFDLMDTDDDIGEEKVAADIEELDLPDLDEVDLDIEEDLSDIEEEAEPAETTIPTAEEGLEDLDFDDDESLETEELPELEMDEPLAEDIAEEPMDEDIVEELIDEDAEAAPADDSFDDVAAFEEDMYDEGPRETGSDTATAVLQKIEEELSTIKNELSSLKSELARIKSQPAEGAAEEPGEEASEGEVTGFFADDEDETIALTGDELDNILTTADITEEAGEAVAPEEDIVVEEEKPQERLMEGEDIITPEKESPETLPFVEESDDDLPDLSDLDVDEEIADVPEDTLSDLDLDLEDLEEPGTLEVDEDFTEPEDSAEDDLPEPDLDLEPPEEEVLDELELELPAEDEDEQPESAFEEEPDIDLDMIDVPEVESIDLEGDEVIDLDISEDLEDEAPEDAEEPEPFEEMNEDLDFSLEEELEETEVSEDEELSEIELTEEESSEIEEEMNLEEFEMTAEDTDIPEEELVKPSESDVFEQIEELSDEEVEVVAETETLEEDLSFEEPEQEEPLSEEFIGDDAIPELDVEGFEDLSELSDTEVAEITEEPAGEPSADTGEEASFNDIPENLKSEIRSVLSYMDQLLESLPEEKIQEFAQSDHFDTYKRLFEDLGLKV